jgi:glycosyltransferase involved in cell wall biosynthesis
MTGVSIAMATYNGGQYFQAQLDSFARQTRLPDELIIHDDGSTDDTLDVARQFAAEAPFAVRVIENSSRLGYNRNFEAAVNTCSGDIIFISDQDDEWHSNKIEQILADFQSDPAVLLVVNDQTITDPAGNPSLSTVLGNIRNLGYSDNLFCSGCCTAFRRQLLAIASPFALDNLDYDYWLNIIPALLGARTVEEQPLQLYRRHASNSSNSVFAVDRASVWTLASPARRRDPRPLFERRIRGLGDLLQRLEDRRPQIDSLGLGDRVAAAKAQVARERQAYADRTRVLGYTRLKRALSIAQLLRDGTYKQFQGYKSGIKDLLT